MQWHRGTVDLSNPGHCGGAIQSGEFMFWALPRDEYLDDIMSSGAPQ